MYNLMKWRLLRHKIAKKIEGFPLEAKYRNLKTSGAKFAAAVWKFKHARELLTSTGWVPLEDDRVVLPSDCSTELLLRMIREHPYVANWSLIPPTLSCALHVVCRHHASAVQCVGRAHCLGLSGIAWGGRC